MNRSISILILVVVVGAVLGLLFFNTARDETTLNPTRITKEVSADQSVLLDVRTSAELAADGFAAGSTHLEITRLQHGELPDVTKDTRIYVYCKGGTRAGIAEGILEENGFTDVVNIGGLVDWEAAGGEVIR